MKQKNATNVIKIRAREDVTLNQRNQQLKTMLMI